MTLMAMVWQNLGGCTSKMFIDENFQPVSEFEADQVISMRYKDEATIDRWFMFRFAKGRVIKAHINENFVTCSFYVNKEVMESLGQEFRKALDIALAGSGFKAVV